MMYDNETQANPTEYADERLADLRSAVSRTVTVLEENKKAVRVWFLKGLLGFNLIIGSVVFWVVVIPFLLENASAYFGS
jgi:hypothetical protein